MKLYHKPLYNSFDPCPHCVFVIHKNDMDVWYCHNDHNLIIVDVELNYDKNYTTYRVSEIESYSSMV